jgi:hypothetical protein
LRRWRGGCSAGVPAAREGAVMGTAGDGPAMFPGELSAGGMAPLCSDVRRVGAATCGATNRVALCA